MSYIIIHYKATVLYNYILRVPMIIYFCPGICICKNIQEQKQMSHAGCRTNCPIIIDINYM